jgi:hypothetical protein
MRIYYGAKQPPYNEVYMAAAIEGTGAAGTGTNVPE